VADGRFTKPPQAITPAPQPAALDAAAPSLQAERMHDEPGVPVTDLPVASPLSDVKPASSQAAPRTRPPPGQKSGRPPPKPSGDVDFGI
jgi:hypothetical protein